MFQAPGEVAFEQLVQDCVRCEKPRGLGWCSGPSDPLSQQGEQSVEFSAAWPSQLPPPSSDTISGYLNLYLEAEISVDQPLEGNRTKCNGTSPTFHSH